MSEEHVTVGLPGSAKDTIKKLLHEHLDTVDGAFSTEEQRGVVLEQFLDSVPDREISKTAWLCDLADPAIGKLQSQIAASGVRALQESVHGGLFSLPIDVNHTLKLSDGKHIKLVDASIHDLNVVRDRLQLVADAKLAKVKDFDKALIALTPRLIGGKTIGMLANGEELQFKLATTS